MKKLFQNKPLTIDIKKYGGKQVAVYKGKIVSSGENAKEALDRASMKHPRVSVSEFRIFSVPKTIYSILICHED